jgi:hypothetical protein
MSELASRAPWHPNTLSPFLMSPTESRTELCHILALGVLRLRQPNSTQLFDDMRESSLHFPPDQWRHATPTHRRPA